MKKPLRRKGERSGRKGDEAGHATGASGVAAPISSGGNVVGGRTIRKP